MFAAACTSSDSPAGTPSYDSVRDRLSDGPTRLFVGADGSSGSITARRWTNAGWVEGVTPVTIEAGELSATVDGHGTLAVDKLVVELAPIDVPEDVFKKPAQLDDVKVSLRAPTSGTLTWSGDDDATATLTLMLDFDWAIVVNGGKTPLGTQHLPPIMIDVAFSGGGDHVEASLALHAAGELWSWAGLLEMTSLDLSLAAATVD